MPLIFYSLPLLYLKDMGKEALRQHAKSLRLSMSDESVGLKSEVIIDQLISKVYWQSISSVHCYVPINRLHEVNTWPLLKYIWINHPNILTAVPTSRQRGKYESIKVNQATRWRGLLPGSRIATPKSFKFDLIVVPTLAFDNRLYRLGWGGGFYDRFLDGQSDALKIGLCFENGRLAKIPNEPHDIKLDKIVTEECIID